MGLEPNEYLALEYPERELKVYIPLKWMTAELMFLKDIECSIPRSEDREKAVLGTIKCGDKRYKSPCRHDDIRAP